MTPADGSDFRGDATGPGEAAAGRPLPLAATLLLHGGRTLLLIEGAGAPPPVAGTLEAAGGAAPLAWTALTWQGATGEVWHGIAALDAMPPAAGGTRLAGADGSRWHLPAPERLDIAPETLAAFVRRTGAGSREVYAFLVTRLLSDLPAESAAARTLRGFARSFVAAAAEPDGFIEILAAPETGGLFAQGWSMHLAPGTVLLANPDEDLASCEAEVATFARDDILPPGQGFAFFGKFWSEASLAAAGAVFFEKDGRLLRLDVVRSPMTLAGAAASAHVKHMLTRLEAPTRTLGAFRRICRPRFQGTDTLSGTTLPIACAFDSVLQAPDGALLVTGWMLDPLHRVERALLKSSANLYARLDADWCALPRPDLVRGFGTDPRFAGLLDEHEAMYGFLVQAPAARERVEGAEVYLELVLDDGSCLFRPVTVLPFESAERLPQLLAPLSPVDPELGRIVTDHLAPFLDSVPPLAPRTGRSPATRALRLGPGSGSGGSGRAVQAVIPFQSWQHIQPILALLVGTPEAEMLDLTLVTSRRIASETMARLEQAFAFYGLAGSLSIAPDAEGDAARLDLGALASNAPQLLAWSPSALPRAPGWLSRLLDEAATLPPGSLLSPSLTYEDGSIFYGGGAADIAGACSLAGYAADWLPRGDPRRAPTGAAEVALIDRAALAEAGGFAGRLFGDAFAHLDLADRLVRSGRGCWCSGAVDFWILDDHAAEIPTAAARVIRQIDAALIARRSAAPAASREARP